MAELPIGNHDNTVQGAHRDFEEEEGSSTNASTQVEQGSQHALIDEAKKVKKLFDDFDDAFRDPENTSFYVVSQNWINEWKKYVSYDNVIQGLEPEKEFFGQEAPGKINEDIVDSNPKFLPFTGYPEDKSFTNVLLRDGLQEGRDYKLITGPTWRYLHKQYGGIPVKRPCKTFPNGQRQVEVRLKKIELVPVNNAFLRSVDHERARDFKVFIFQAPSFRTIKDFKSDLIDVCNSDIGKKWFDNSSPLSYSYSLFADDTLRFWKLDPSVTLSDMFSFVKGKCKKSTSYEYRIEFKGTYLLKDPEITLEEAEIADNDYVFLEAREQGRGWNFVGDNAPTIDKCEFCNKYEELPIQCACKKASYCSEECKFRDKRFHQMKCDKTTEEEEEQNKQMVMTASSRKGLCGLQNLGNTCFMNSGLQCLSNIKELTEYFLSDKYLKEVNETNPLGTKGKLVKKYGMFLKNLWFGASTVHSPWSLKHAISEFQPMFSGYQQHDSQELLSFLLDGIHEDLNRVKNKPFTETIESESQPDYETGLKSWENHLKRNQSIIVDLLHGQFKSQITCPTCSRISITFDPFNCVSLPIPTKTEKEIDFIFLHANHKEKPVKVKISFNPNTHTVAQLKAQTAEILKKDPNTFYFVFMSQHSKQVITEEAKTMTNDVRKKKKVHSLFAYEIAQEDLHAHPDELYHVDYSTSKGGLNYFGRPTRKKFAYRRTVCLRKKFTAREVYIKVFKQYRNLWTEALPEDQQEAWSNLSDEEAFKQVWEDVEEKPFKILLVTNARIFHECYFCGEKKCDNCELKCDSGATVDDLLNQIKDPEFKLEFEIYFEHAPEYLDLERLDSYTDLSKEKSAEDEKDRNINIYRCFEQFEEPEVLGEENAWYCSRCKAHQRATKKMEIYKAPPILMIHLKRFKSTGMSSFASKSKISAKIDFPEKDFDISEYVLNHELPLDYPVERIIPGYHDGETLNGTTMSTTAASAEDGAAQGTEEERKMEVEPATVTSSKNHREKIEEEKAQTNGKSALLYDLFGVVNHYGNLGFGHYTAYAKNHLNGKWHCFDDSSVSDEDADSICTPASYVLFYKRKDWTFNH